MTLEIAISLIPLASFCLFLILQLAFPKRAMPHWFSQIRVIHNLGLFAVNLLVSRFIVPVSLVLVATQATKSQFGLFHLFTFPYWLEVTLAVVLLDLAIYWQHVATHKIPLLWRLHKVHHADREMDVTTAVRFHPIELVLSMAYKAGVIWLLGAPELAVGIFVVLLFVGPAFNHGNIAMPAGLDRTLRWVVATPDAHRIHHSTHRNEQDTNYGFCLIWWDRLFGTYTEQPRDNHETMMIGLPRKSEGEQTRLDQMLLAPFK